MAERISSLRPASVSAGAVSALAGSSPVRKSFAVRGRVCLLLIAAGTITSLLLKNWALPHYCALHENNSHTMAGSLFYSFIYSASIGSLLFYSGSQCWGYISRRPFPLNWVLLFVSILIPAVAGTMLSSLLLVALGQHPPDSYASITMGSLQLSLVLSLIFGTSFYLYENLKGELEAATLELRTRQLEEERARKLALAAQFSSLESRVRPHFLFNTLNSISALIREHPERAERMVEQLSALLRFSLDASVRQTVPLRHELKLVNDYLEIEKTRFNERLRFSLDVPAELGATPVPPFALQTLVENSVKHAIAPRREGGEIRVTARAEEGGVRLEVRDDGPGFAPNAIISGHGLDNLQARLAALFPGHPGLEIESHGGSAEGAKDGGDGRGDDIGTRVTLLLPRD